MSKNGRRYNIHSAVGMVAGKNNAVVWGHDGDADGESGAGTLDSYAHNSIKNLSRCKQGI